MNTRHPMVFATAFFVSWLAILYAGADHPPPASFLWLVPLAGVCAVGAYLRASVYAAWSRARSAGRFFRVLWEGFAAGLAVGFIVMLAPFAGEPGIPAVGIADNLIWLAVLGGVGIANAGLLYFLVTATARGDAGLPD